MKDRRSIAEQYARYGLMPIGGGDGTDDPATPADPAVPVEPEQPARPAKIEFTPEQQAFFNAKIAEETDKAVAKAIAARDAADAEARKREDAEATRKMREAMKEQGRQNELIDSLTKELDEVKAENARLAESAGKYEQSVEADYAALVAQLPASVLVFDPGPQASIDRKRAFVDQAREATGKLDEPFKPGTPPSPDPTRNPRAADDIAQIELHRRRRMHEYTSLG